MPDPAPDSPRAPNVAVLLYDGECGLCNNAVRFLLRIDRRARLRFAPLQGPTAQSYLRSRSLPTEDFDSMVFVSDWSQKENVAPRFRTDGILGALRAIGGIWKLSAIFSVVPKSLRDALYRLIARSRYRLFGEYRPRPFARAEWAERFFP